MILLPITSDHINNWKKIIKIIVSMELIENIIFLFIQHESNCWYSAKKKPTFGQTVAFFFFSAVNESMQLYMCVSILIPPEKSLKNKWFIVFFKCSPVFLCCGGSKSNRVPFFLLIILHLCHFRFSWVIGFGGKDSQ